LKELLPVHCSSAEDDVIAWLLKLSLLQTIILFIKETSIFFETIAIIKKRQRFEETVVWKQLRSPD
jgi:hypothetical protein